MRNRTLIERIRQNDPWSDETELAAWSYDRDEIGYPAWDDVEELTS